MIKMNRHIQYLLQTCVFLIGFLTLSQSQAQVAPILLFQDSIKPWNSMIHLQSEFNLGSNSVDMGMMNESVFGGHLEKQQLERQLQRMKSYNRIGGFATSSLQFFNFQDTLWNQPHIGLQAGIHTMYMASAHFSKNLFQLIYNGNAQTDTVPIGAVRAQFQAYQKFSIGLFNKKNWNSLSLSFVFGQSMRDLQLYNGQLTTSSLGDTLTLSYAGHYHRSDTSMRGIANGAGLGAAVDFDYNLPMANNKGIISISIRDLGFIVWNNQASKFDFNGKSNWTGLETTNYVQNNFDSIALPNFRDSLDYERTVKSIWKPLPTRINFRYLHQLRKGNYYEFGMMLMPGTAALPQIYFGLSQQPFPSLIFSQTINYGGFGGWGVGASIQYLPKKSWYIRLETQHLGGFTMSSARSRQIQLSIAKIFHHVHTPSTEIPVQ
jgi:Family of unknown function (DUF5723)